MIFQDSMTALNPVLTVGQQMRDILRRHQQLDKKTARSRAIAMLERVGIVNAAQRYNQYPHEFSGGMRQRVMIAIALCCHPALLIADEPTTALDVTIQAQILRLLKQLQQQTGSAIMLITHDLGVVAQLCSRVVVMYGGLVMEEGCVEDIFSRPAHPYTQGLLASLPRHDVVRQRLSPIEGAPPGLLQPPAGCPFAARCSQRIAICEQQPPPVSGVAISTGYNAGGWTPGKQIMQTDSSPLVRIRALKKYYALRRGGQQPLVRALDGISMDIWPGETYGLVGESGCGKSTLGHSLLRLFDLTGGTFILRVSVSVHCRKKRSSRFESVCRPFFKIPTLRSIPE
ncbi:Oligopeptide transport system permease protein OppB (TC 3.A.1.5.1) [Dickeya aquatica]|uniref:ABC-type dipeptide transporter n=1 Tax=Dickeya aquatica TaxID=1401087 RepID=A0A375A9G6_9GAMM|nr:Oligopeptide transport system permease protein OppB (TC 3.A.1.5.1) [Dickeya aquatica]